MSIWKQMDRQQEGEIHAKLIGATHPIRHLQNAACSYRQLRSVGPSDGEGTASVCPEHPRAFQHLSTPWH